MNILEKKKKISKNQQKINSIKKNGKSANEHLTQTGINFILTTKIYTVKIKYKGKTGHD